MNKKNIVKELTKITSAVARAENLDDQISNIVNAISSAIEVDVCSLYTVGDTGELSLLTSHGLNQTHPITIPIGRGLVGHVVREKHSINLDNAEDHPDYYYVDGSGEESFRSFCAVPLVDHGQVVGVLVAQSREWGALDEEREAFLETLAFHLVIILRNVDLQIKPSKGQFRVTGVSGAPGVAIAKVKRVSTRSLDEVGYHLADDLVAEKNQFSVLIEQFSQQIDADRKLFDRATHDEISAVYSAIYLFLNDPQFRGLMEGFIESGQNIPTALKSGMQHLVGLFEAMGDEYLRSKAEDVRYLCNRLYKLWLDSSSVDSAVEDGEPYIIVGKNIDISHLSAFSGNLLGIISSEGSALSHVSVIANALGVPAILGVAEPWLPD
ncbi:MAG: signal transduction protein with GAF and PtsI domain, partial [Gammaproteobacteria bacterium]